MDSVLLLELEKSTKLYVTDSHEGLEKKDPMSIAFFLRLDVNSPGNGEYLFLLRTCIS